MLAYALVIASALLHASWNALVKRTRDPAASVHTVVATAGALTGIAAVGEWAVTGRGGSATALGLAAIAGVLEAGYFHALGRALTLGPLGPVYTISRGGAALLVWPASMLAFGERLTPLGAGGSALILLGLAASTSVATVPGRAVQYAVACAGCIAGYNLTYKLALESGGRDARRARVPPRVRDQPARGAVGHARRRRDLRGRLRLADVRAGPRRRRLRLHAAQHVGAVRHRAGVADRRAADPPRAGRRRAGVRRRGRAGPLALSGAALAARVLLPKMRRAGWSAGPRASSLPLG